MLNEQTKKWAKIIVPVLILIISISCSGFLSSPEFHKKTIQSLDDKKQNVTLMLATTAAVSNVITMLPDDICTPLANEVADLTSYLLLITCIVYLEKYLLTIAGWAVFSFLIPLACILWILEQHFPELKKRAVKMAMTGLLLFMLIPVSEHISCMISDTYDFSIEENMKSTNEVMGDIQENTEEDSNGVLTALWDKIKGGITGTVEKIGDSLDNMVDSVAIMIVTSCGIPLLTLFAATKILAVFTGINITINLPKRGGRSKGKKKMPKGIENTVVPKIEKQE